MIYATGDTHGSFGRRFSTKNFPAQMKMTKDDYLIICGDFGCIWENDPENKEEQYWLKWFNERPYTLLFVDGNHDNHERLASYPVEKWNGGKVHRIRDSVFHLMRGQVYIIDELTVFTFGGASSHDIRDGILEPDDPRIKEWNRDYDKLFRINKRSWWERELPSRAEMEEGRQNLEKVDWKVDFVFTHCTSSSTTALLGLGTHEQDILTRYLQEIREKLDYRYWLFGHHHMDKAINSEEICLYEQIVQIR
jgi:hypothetical protein